MVGSFGLHALASRGHSAASLGLWLWLWAGEGDGSQGASFRTGGHHTGAGSVPRPALPAATPRGIEPTAASARAASLDLRALLPDPEKAPNGVNAIQPSRSRRGDAQPSHAYAQRRPRGGQEAGTRERLFTLHTSQRRCASQTRATTSLPPPYSVRRERPGSSHSYDNGPTMLCAPEGETARVRHRETLMKGRGGLLVGTHRLGPMRRTPTQKGL